MRTKFLLPRADVEAVFPDFLDGAPEEKRGFVFQAANDVISTEWNKYNNETLTDTLPDTVLVTVLAAVGSRIAQELFAAKADIVEDIIARYGATAVSQTVGDVSISLSAEPGANLQAGAAGAFSLTAQEKRLLGLPAITTGIVPVPSGRYRSESFSQRRYSASS